MPPLIFASYLSLLRFDFLMNFCDFKTIHAAVRRERRVQRDTPRYSDRSICHAVDLASVFYFKRVLCLQRSAAATVLLRRQGWNAEMVIGAQLLPFQSHAWVEVDGRVVNDKPYVTDIFQVLERC